MTCKHVQWLRDRLPAFEGQPDRYVVWGEGTTDEMCLGILQVTRPLALPGGRNDRAPVAWNALTAPHRKAARPGIHD